MLRVVYPAQEFKNLRRLAQISMGLGRYSVFSRRNSKFAPSQKPAICCFLSTSLSLFPFGMTLCKVALRVVVVSYPDLGALVDERIASTDAVANSKRKERKFLCVVTLVSSFLLLLRWF